MVGSVLYFCVLYVSSWYKSAEGEFIVNSSSVQPVFIIFKKCISFKPQKQSNMKVDSWVGRLYLQADGPENHRFHGVRILEENRNIVLYLAFSSGDWNRKIGILREELRI